MKRLTEQQVWLVVNALREKATGDREVVVTSKSTGPVAAALMTQANNADELADQLENASRVTVNL